MAKKEKSPSYVAEFQVRTISADRKAVRSRLEAGRQLYNATLGESLRRLAGIRRDPAFAAAKAMPGKSGEEINREKQAAFQELREKYSFREYDLHKHPSLAADCWLRNHLDVHAAQKIATRAFKAAERYSFGLGGKPKFKRYGELESVEGKSNAAGIRYRSGSVLWNGTYAKLALPLIVKPNDQVQAYALQEADSGKVKYVRLVSRRIRGKERIHAQLVLKGLPWIKLDKNGDVKHPVQVGKAGMDLGPSHVAVVTEGKVESIPFCPDLERKEAGLRRYLRQMGRQRRANNPGNYHPDGTVKKGKLVWKRSGREKRTSAKLAETYRKTASHRKSMQGETVHKVLTFGNHILAEKTDKQEWAWDYGRSISHKAPGAFETRVAALAKAAGGNVEFVSTYTTYLSSRCLCGLEAKKLLSERQHICGCGYVPVGAFVDRDEFSAFLVMFCRGGTLDVESARSAWKLWGADCLLRSTSDHQQHQVASGKAVPTRRAREARQSDSTDHHRSMLKRKAAPTGNRKRQDKLKDLRIPVPELKTRKLSHVFSTGNP